MLALEQALAILNEPIEWVHGDDLCDCTFQRIGSWYNPYVGERLEVRLCCIWSDIYKRYPEFVKVTRCAPAEWNGETDMPKALWHRQLANVWNLTVPEAREMNQDPPKGIQRPPRRSFFSRVFGRG